jgi:hypothetical protein
MWDESSETSYLPPLEKYTGDSRIDSPVQADIQLLKTKHGETYLLTEQSPKLRRRRRSSHRKEFHNVLLLILCTSHKSS